jgi:hypothetical protein
VRPGKSSAASVEFSITGWPGSDYHVVVNGLRRKPAVRLDALEISLSAPHAFIEPPGLLILKLAESPVGVRIQIDL